MSVVQIEGQFPELLPIKESLIRYVFEPNSKQVRFKCRGTRRFGFTTVGKLVCSITWRICAVSHAHLQRWSWLFRSLLTIVLLSRLEIILCAGFQSEEGCDRDERKTMSCSYSTLKILLIFGNCQHCYLLWEKLCLDCFIIPGCLWVNPLRNPHGTQTWNSTTNDTRDMMTPGLGNTRTK